MAALTLLGARDAPPVNEAAWNMREIAGASLIQTSDRCVRCHKADGLVPPIEPGHIVKPPDWIAMHVADPEVIAAGIRDAPQAGPTSQADTRAMVAALSHLRSSAPPAVDAETLHLDTVFTRFCLDCHTLDAVGGEDGPDLSHIGLKLSAATIVQRVTNPKTVMADAEMPAFDGKIPPEDIRAIANWLALRK